MESRAEKKNVAYTCEICGKKFSPEDLEIHHKNHNQGDNRRDNLMVLCRDCHNKIHSVEGGEEIFIDSEFIELIKLFQYHYAGKLRAQAIEIFESAAQGGSDQAVGELVKFYGDKNFLSDFAEDDSPKNFFDDAQKLFVEILKDCLEPTNNFP